MADVRGMFCAQINLLKLNKDSSFSELLRAGIVFCLHIDGDVPARASKSGRGNVPKHF